MKKIRSILTGVTALALLINLIGCDKEIPDPPPTVKFYVNGVETKTAIVKEGAALNYDLCVHAPGKIKSITLYEGVLTFQRTIKLVKTTDFTSIDSDSSSYSSVAAVGYTTRVYVDAVDQYDQKTTSVLYFSIYTGAGPIITWTDVVMGLGQAWSPGQPFFSCALGKTYSYDQFEVNKGTIDLFFSFYAVDASPAMASPNLYSASGNATLYDKSTVTPEAFEGITNDEKLTGINPSKTTTSLVKDGVYLFRTGHGKNGIFRVKEVSPGGGGRLVFTVKVQQ